MSLSFHQVIRDKRTGKTKGFLEEVDSQGIQQKIHSKLEIHPTIEVSWWKKKMVDDFDDY